MTERVPLDSRMFFLTKANRFGSKMLRGTHIVTDNGVTILYDNEGVVGVFNLAPGESLAQH